MQFFGHIYGDINIHVYFIRDKKGGVEKKCETCGHTWWVSKNSEKQKNNADHCFECAYNYIEDIEECGYCGLGNGCGGCSGPEEYDGDDFWND